jgi:hypothetical protein
MKLELGKVLAEVLNDSTPEEGKLQPIFDGSLSQPPAFTELSSRSKNFRFEVFTGAPVTDKAVLTTSEETDSEGTWTVASQDNGKGTITKTSQRVM